MGLSRIPFGTILLLVLAGFLHLATMMCLSDVPNGDAAGRGMALGYAAILGTATMILLAILLVVAAMKGEMSRIGKVGAFVLVPAVTVTMWVAGDLYTDQVGWALLVPALLPPLVTAYALRARLPSLRARMGASTADLVLGTAIVALTIAPFVGESITASPAEKAQAKALEMERFNREMAEQRAADQRATDAFARLGPDSSLGDYLQYLPGGDTLSREALAGARKVKSRQADAVALLKAGRLEGLAPLFKLDLQPTPELCAAYGEALGNAASKVTRARPDYLSIAIDLEQQVPNIKWLVEGGCDLNTALASLSEHVRAVSDSERMKTFAAILDSEKR